MKILGILNGAVKLPRAVHIYRLTMPLNYINKQTKHSAYWASASSMAQLLAPEIEKYIESDIIILGRMISDDLKAVGDYIAFVRSKGASIVYETDDDLTEEYRDISSGEGKTSIPFLQSAGIDAFTVTTEYLARQVAKHSFGQPIYVLPNCIETNYWTAACRTYERKYSDTVNIMLVGTPTHGDDWILAHHAALRILDEYPNTRLLVGGYHPDYIGDDDRVIKMPYTEYAMYPTMLAEADIVMCAIDPNDPFNYSKSAVKAMESWAAQRKLNDNTYGGAAVIATNSVVYNGTVINERNGLLVDHNVDEYYLALNRLVGDERMRYRLQRTGMSDVAKKHSIKANYGKWVSAYNRIRRIKQ